MTKVSNTASASGGVAKYTVEITVPKDEKMKAGMNASATITIEEKENIVTIPVNALQERDVYKRQVYWRVLWLLPVVPVIAVAMTEFLKERKGILQFLLVIAAAGAVAAVSYTHLDVYKRQVSASALASASLNRFICS